MGTSSFKLLRVAPHYFFALLRTFWHTWRGRHAFVKPVETAPLPKE
jgi:hypothetical protein